MSHGRLFIGATILGAVTLAAPARADGPPSDLPKWCAGYDGSMDTSSGSIEDDAKNDGYATDRVAQDLARASCGYRSSAEGTKKIRDRVVAGRAKFQAATGLDDAETDELLAIEMDKKGAEAANDAFCKAIKVDEDDATPHEFSEFKARKYLVCDRGYGSGEYDWTDITEIEKVAQVSNCFHSLAGNFSSETDKFARQPWPMLEFATCNVLATRIDSKAYLEEVAADKRFNRYATLWAKAALTETLTRRSDVQAVYQRIGSKKPVLQELLFTAPEKGYADFMTMYTANQAVIDKARLLLLGANHLKELAKTDAGCSATFEPLLVKAMADKHPADLDAVHAAFQDTYIYYVGLAFATCEAIDGHDLVANAYSTRMVGGRVAGTARDAAAAATLAVMFANADDIDGVRDMTVQRMAPTVRLDVKAPPFTESEAVIASVGAPKDGKVKVTFKKDVWVEQLYDCKDTGRIDHIDDDGKFVYQQSCTPAGTQKHVDKVEPVLVEQRFAGALKAGAFLEMRVASGKDREAIPLTVYSDKDKKKLVGFLGFAL